MHCSKSLLRIALLAALLFVTFLYWNGAWRRKKGTPYTRVQIEVNPESQFASSNVLSIWHGPSNDEVCVQLANGSKCPHPKLIGRLSGSSLAMLEEWTLMTPSLHFQDFATSHDGTSIHCGSYKDSWLSHGSYSLEIIVVHCNDFGMPSLLERAEGNLTRWLQHDFGKECIEDPRGHRITSIGATVIVDRTIISDLVKGHWMYKKSNIMHGKNILMRTRYQPEGCALGAQDPQSQCGKAMENGHLKDFDFIWRDDEWMQKLAPLQINASLVPKLAIPLRVEDPKHLEISHVVDDLTARMRSVNEFMKWEDPKLCLVGRSHSYHLYHALWLNGVGYRFVWTNLAFPEELATSFFEKSYFTFNCTKFIINVGHWPLSWGTNHKDNMTYGKLWDQIAGIVNNEEIFRIGRGDIKLYMRTMHHIPLGTGPKGALTCNDGRPVDWRSPTAIDGYNYALERIVNERNESDRVELIDTRFITFPLWDMGYDFNHLHPHVSKVEALYIASKVLLD